MDCEISPHGHFAIKTPLYLSPAFLHEHKEIIFQGSVVNPAGASEVNFQTCRGSFPDDRNKLSFFQPAFSGITLERRNSLLFSIVDKSHQ